MMAGVISPVVRMGGQLEESCSTTANFDWLAIFGLAVGGLMQDEDDWDSDEIKTVIGGEGQGGDRGREELLASGIAVTVIAWLLLWVGSEEGTEGRWDSLVN
jgi:hypothetical protein